MASIQQLLDDIKLRYRHTFTNAQVLVWMNEEQRDLFEILQIDSPPYSFTLVASTYFYPIPTDIEIDKIKTISIQINDDTTPDFTGLPFKRNDDGQEVSIAEYWYTIVDGNFYINVPGGPVANRKVYVYFDKSPAEISTANLAIEPSTPAKYQEILKLGTLERIAAARKDIGMKNNYASDKEQKILDATWHMKTNEPEFISPIDVLPKRAGRTVSSVISG